jgi:hypothetical protein
MSLRRMIGWNALPLAELDGLFPTNLNNSRIDSSSSLEEEFKHPQRVLERDFYRRKSLVRWFNGAVRQAPFDFIMTWVNLDLSGLECSAGTILRIPWTVCLPRFPKR